MRIAAFSDTHLDGGGLPGGSNPQWRQEDFRKAFNTVIEEICIWGPDLILFGGDAFHSRIPTPQRMVAFVKGLKWLAKKAPVVLIPGNHDTTSQGSSLEVLGVVDLANIDYIDKPGAIEINDAQVFGMPVVAKSWIAAARKEYKVIDDIEREVERLVQTGIRAFLAQPFDGPRIFVGHLTTLGGTFGGFRPATLGHEVFWQSSWFDGFDAVALGHLHRHQLPDPSRPWIAYCGSTEKLDFGERDEDKGWMSVDLSDEEPVWEFHKIHSRPMVQIEMMSTQEPFPDVHPDSIVKVILHLEAGQHAPEIDVDCKYLLPPIYLWAEEPRQGRFDVGIVELPPEEILLLYFEAKGFSQERVSILLPYAREIMAQ